MSETGNYRCSAAQVHEPQTRDPEFDSRSFAEILRNSYSKKTKKVFAETHSDRNKLVVILKTTPTPKELH
jgi:hypothetical protein